jgi:Immunoglobulin domain/PA14 domain
MVGSDGGGSYQNATFGEFIVINGTVSTADRQKLEGYLAHKWGMTANLPAIHPYKSVAPSIGGAVATSVTVVSATSVTCVTPAGAAGAAVAVAVTTPGGTATLPSAYTYLAPPTITTHPANTAVTAGQTATFTVVASGAAPLTYQWKRGTSNVGTNSATLSIPNAQTANAGSYTCVVTNSVGAATSNAATLTVNNAPFITKHPVSVIVMTGQTATLTVAASGTAPLTYQWKQGTTNVGTNSATLSIANAQAANAGSYTCVVTNSAGTAASNAATLTVSATSSGLVLHEWWNGISGTTVASLTGNAAYPNSPTGADVLNMFEIGTNTADNYGTRVRGYVIPPTTGNYTFWIAGDDNCELWLSTNTDPANRTRIAYVSGWTNSREWTKLTGQQSALIPLVAGQKYYIEALHKEGTGGDNLAVGWQLPNATLERPIPGLRLEAFVPISPTITSQPTNRTVTAGQAATFTVAASGTAPLTYQWKKNGTTNVGTNSATLSIANAQLVDAGMYHCVVTNSAGTATTIQVTLTVTNSG